MKFKGFFGAVKNYWAPIALTCVVVSIALGSTIAMVWNKAKTTAGIA